MPDDGLSAMGCKTNQSVVKGFREKFEDSGRLVVRDVVRQREIHPVVCGGIRGVSEKFCKLVRLCGWSGLKEKPLGLQTDIGDVVGTQDGGDFGLD